jgi:hypothetical protein
MLVLILAFIVSILPPEVPPQSSRSVVERSYTLGAPSDIAVGESAARVRGYELTTRFYFVYVAENSVRMSAGMTATDVAAGREFRIVGRRIIDGVSYEVAVVREFPDSSMSALLVAPDGTIYNHYVGRTMYGTWVEAMPKVKFQPETLTLRREKRETATRSGATVNFEMIYSGQDGASIRFDYREYTADDLARPAFSQTLTYPKSVKAFRFRDLAFEVNALADDHITLTVTSDRPAP